MATLQVAPGSSRAGALTCTPLRSALPKATCTPTHRVGRLSPVLPPRAPKRSHAPQVRSQRVMSCQLHDNGVFYLCSYSESCYRCPRLSMPLSMASSTTQPPSSQAAQRPRPQCPRQHASLLHVRPGPSSAMDGLVSGPSCLCPWCPASSCCSPWPSPLRYSRCRCTTRHNTHVIRCL